MRRIRRGVSLAACTAALCSAGPAAAQDLAQRAAVDSAAAVRLVVEPDGHLEPAVLLDASSAINLSHGVTLVVRPVVYGAGEDWDARLYQALLRAERGGAIRWRVDGGYITPPIGIAMFDARPDVNPTLLPPFVYGSALGTLETGVPPVRLLSPVYPLGVQASASSSRWDVRAAVTDSSAARARGAFADDPPARAPQFTIGGGVTPWTGLRVGAGWSRGTFAAASETADGASRGATLSNIEFDWSGGYGRVYGEWIRGAFDRAGPRAIAHAFTITGVRTLGPRWFAAARVQTLRRPPALYHHPPQGDAHEASIESASYAGDLPGDAAGGEYETCRWSAEGTVGFRLSPELTLRAGYIGYRAIDERRWEHEAGIALSWSRRWW